MSKGRGGGGPRGRRGRGGGRGGGRNQGQGRDTFRYNKQELVKKNERFESYYNSILSLADEEEKERFWDALRRDLPNSFRFTGSKGHALAVQQRLIEHYIPEIIKIDFEGKKVEPPEQIPWFPNKLAWQMTTPKNVVRRFPPFKAFQQFLVSETSTGNINRQEIVSMIPPLLLDVQPGHTVLDLCAAPGSKSAQLIEAVHAGEETRLKKQIKSIRKAAGREVSPEGAEERLEAEDSVLMQDNSDDGRATGLLIANDVDYRRAHMLIHQMKRLNSPNLIVTNHDATLFPSIKLPTLPQPPGGPRPSNRYLKFDRILADVPCSGDGTARKNSNVWKDWTPSNGLGLHATQIKILVRALQMLKVGGRVVYSTCSMNPVENEAVVAAAIKACGGLEKVGILEAASKLPGLKYKPGFNQWKIMDKHSRMWDSFADVKKQLDEHGVEGLSRLADSMFPPDADEKIPLDLCIRVEPHQQDTGGFFITVLEKKSDIKARQDHARTVTQMQAEAEAKDETTNPGQPLPSITQIAKEIDAKVPNATTGAIDHIESLDALAPPAPPIVDDGNVSAAARMNTEIPDESALAAGTKRPAAEELDGEMGSKKAKTGEEVTAVEGVLEDGRLEHWPPPPASRLDVEAAHKDAEAAQRAAGEESAQPIQQSDAQHRDKKNNNGQSYEEPYKYLDPDLTALEDIYSFYGLDARFPRTRYMVRNANGEPTRTIYYTTDLVRDILTANEGTGMKFVHSGVKMFVKQDIQREDQCAWRIQTDGLQLIEAWVSDERVVRLTSRKTLHRLLKEMFPKVNDGAWRDLCEVGDRVRDIGLGCCVLRVEPGEGDDSFSERMVLPLWRSLHSVNIMLPKEDRRALLLRLFNDNEEVIDHQKQRAHMAQATTSAAASNIQGPGLSADNNDPPPPGHSLLVNQRAADLEEVAENYGDPSDDEGEDADELGQAGGVKIETDPGVAMDADEAEQAAELQLGQEEGEGIREGGVGTEDVEEVREKVTGEGRNAEVYVPPKENDVEGDVQMTEQGLMGTD